VRLAYFDCFSGITGGMALGALVHAGADLALISSALSDMPIGGFVLEQEPVEVQDIAALRIHVHAEPLDVIRTYGSVRGLLREAKLPDAAKRTALRIYQRLAEAAARVHSKEVDVVTFSEFGELECLIEFVGCAIALHSLGVERVYASSVPTGLGMIRTEHGMTPIPSPVVLELLRGAPTYSRGIPVELVTASGAAILAALSEGYGDMPVMRSENVGYGAGTLRLDFPNVLRVVIGEEQRTGLLIAPTGAQANAVLVAGLARGLDELVVEAIVSELLGAGAVDAWSTTVTAAGSEPATRIEAVGPADRSEQLAALLRSSAGVRSVTVSPATLTSGA
jgi:pyridinium-3,5-bisthiocarboxylic acid mononucleotide nickel chelatase